MEPKPKPIPVPYHTYIVFAMGLLVYTFTLLLIKGDLFNLYSSNDFPSEEYFKFWKNMTSDQRLFLTETYYGFYLNLKQKILSIQESNKNQNIKINVSFLNSTFLKFNYQYINVPYVVVSLIPTNKQNFKKKLLVASHFDGHNLTDGGTAYDDAIHTVTMLGVIDTISQKGYELNTQVDFLFDGAEEWGLVGAYQYAEHLIINGIKENYDYLNLESMGGKPPYGFVIKNDYGNYHVKKTLSKTRGSILFSFDYIFSLKLIPSTSDHVVFNYMNWTGGVSVFLGDASVYHTKYDKIAKEDHLKIAGCQLLDFVLKYEPEEDGYNGNSVGYGIAPFCIVLPNFFFILLIPLFLLLLLFCFSLKKEKIKRNFSSIYYFNSFALL